MLKALVFDFDGVIVNSEPLHYRALLEVARALGVRFDYAEYLRRYVGYDDRDALRVVLAEADRAQRGRVTGPELTPDDWQGAPKLLAELVDKKGRAFEAIVAHGVPTMPGVAALVRQAAGKLPLAIASGATRRDIDLILGGTGLDGRFDPIITADQVHRSKPHPQTYALAAQGLAERHPALGLTPGDCLAIEDTPAGVAAARGAGLMVLAVAGTCDAELLHQAHRVVPTLEGVGLARLHEWFD